VLDVLVKKPSLQQRIRLVRPVDRLDDVVVVWHAALGHGENVDLNAREGALGPRRFPSLREDGVQRPFPRGQLGGGWNAMRCMCCTVCLGGIESRF